VRPCGSCMWQLRVGLHGKLCEIETLQNPKATLCSLRLMLHREAASGIATNSSAVWPRLWALQCWPRAHDALTGCGQANVNGHGFLSEEKKEKKTHSTDSQVECMHISASMHMLHACTMHICTHHARALCMQHAHVAYMHICAAHSAPT
jgi:hypothetical protein